ncbi:hypothetical protein H8E07_15410 [bacterium]|nr:hypothetical protein [bacterium]
MSRPATWLLLACVVLAAGCAKYNLFYNARKAYEDAERVREQRIKQGEDVSQPTSTQTGGYQLCVKKCQKLLEEYPGHGLTDDALFLMAKSYHRMQSHRMSISRLELLFQNFPSNKYMEEALFLQAANHMFIGDVKRSSEFLAQLQQQFPESKFQAEALRVGGDNAYSLERWEQGRDNYIRFLESHADDEHAPQAGYNLAYCHWMLREYQETHDRLEAVLASELEDHKLLFEVRLLQTRALSRLDRHEEAVALSEEIAPEAELYVSQGLVTLAQAENLINQGLHEEAAPLLENMPEEWQTGDVKPRLGEMLGEIYLRAWDIENAQLRYRDAVRNPRILEDPDRCQRINKALNEFVTAEQRLDGASEDDAPRYKLIEANILLFHLDRPDLALELYRDVASTAASDSASAVRGLYGATIVYRDWLALPDSAAVMYDRIVDAYPDSPQAHMLDPEGDKELYAFLMEQERLAQETRLAENGEADVATAGEILEPVPGDVRDAGVRFSRWRERKLRRNS